MLIFFDKAFLTAHDFLSPTANKSIFLESIIVPIPTVKAYFGTELKEGKSSEFDFLVLSESLTLLVLLLNEEPGSLNPICPLTPIPRTWTSIPPKDLILFS